MAVLQDGKPRVFTQLLSEAGFSHNTLRLHLESLASQGLVVKEKKPSNGLGRPRLAYLIPPRVQQQVSAALSAPSIEIVSLSFSRLKHLCRFEKGGYCKEARKKCEASTYLQIVKDE